MNTHDNREQATPSEAREAILSGLTPAKVQIAVLTVPAIVVAVGLVWSQL